MNGFNFNERFCGSRERGTYVAEHAAVAMGLSQRSSLITALTCIDRKIKLTLGLNRNTKHHLGVHSRIAAAFQAHALDEGRSQRD